MKSICSSTVLTAAITACLALSPFATAARNFTLQQEVRGNAFFDYFYWWDHDDPTHGYVDYVSKSEAQSARLAYVNTRGDFVMQVDNTTDLSLESKAKRKSVRIHSNQLMGDGIIIAKINFMPQGCGTWPAFWTSTASHWPSGGEIDILEGANDQGPQNLASLHTTNGCTIPYGGGNVTSRNDTGISTSSWCGYQPGCSVRFGGENNFGPALNRNGGGYFAMVRDTIEGGEGVSVYFWPASQSSDSLPAALTYPALPYLTTMTNVTSPAYTILSSQWATPAAHFPNSASCPMQNFFGSHNIIFDTTLCGDWAGETFGDTCSLALSCEQFVRENASAFKDARWEIEYLRVYTDSAFSSPLRFAYVLGAVLLSASVLAIF